MHSTGVWFSIPRPQKCFHELAQNSLLMKILPPKNTRYMVCHYMSYELCNHALCTAHVWIGSCCKLEAREPCDPLESCRAIANPTTLQRLLIYMYVQCNTCQNNCASPFVQELDNVVNWEFHTLNLNTYIAIAKESHTCKQQNML